MKKMLAIIMATLLVVSVLAGCGSTNSADENEPVEAAEEAAAEEKEPEEAEPAEEAAGEEGGPISIGLSIDDMAADFCASIASGAEAQAKALGCDIQITDAGMDTSLQASQVENLISSGVDCILLKPYDASANGPISDACTNAGIPLIVITCPISSDYTAYIGVSDDVLGEFMANAIIEEMGGTDFTVAQILGPLAQENLLIMMESAAAVFEDNGIEIVDAQSGENKLDESMSLVENWISSGLTFDVCMCSSDASALGASQALSDAGMRDNVLISGTGGDAEGIQAVLDGKIDMTVWLPGAAFGRDGVNLAYAVCNGEDYEEATLIDLTLLTAENAAEYLN